MCFCKLSINWIEVDVCYIWSIDNNDVKAAGLSQKTFSSEDFVQVKMAVKMYIKYFS